MNKLVSTRNINNEVTYAEAILKGLSKDQGLFVPKSFNKIDFSQKKFLNMSYEEYAYEVLQQFLDFIPKDILKDIIKESYSQKFDHDAIVPLRKIDEQFIVELFHGPTLAFKDMALSVLPNLLKYSKKDLNEHSKTVILTATSGDTGKAALEGFANIEGVEIIVFYPENGVSPIQRKQMLTQKGDNVHVFGIEGNFDDAQSAVKEIFNDIAFGETLKNNDFKFSSANSINIGRLLPQIVYYVSSYFDLIKRNEISYGEKVNFVVPTGNFGNILAGKYAKEIGLPINNFICASNENNILTDFINTGTYDLSRDFIKTISPSMDILISSNLERLLFYLADHNGTKVYELMNDLKINKKYSIDASMKEKMKDFKGYYSTEEETKETIKNVFKEYGYLMDPHTAVAYNVLKKYEKDSNDTTKTLILSTASPFKFPKSVAKAINIHEDLEDFELINLIAKKASIQIPKNIEALRNKKVVHKKNITIREMKDNILKVLNIQ